MHTSDRWRKDQHHTPAPYSSTHITEGWVGPRASPEDLEKRSLYLREKSLTLTGTRTVDPPVRSLVPIL
jgi:hypothetical protein